ncbi:hypothetical protein ATE67_14525 [Sphingopyxis sp. H050]|nr:hypothetical protein ATE67_14525 [Sphingopyxis sp. H050]
MERRALLRGGVLALFATSAGALIWKSANTVPELAPELATPQFVEKLCDMVIPATDTPGAVGAGVADFLPNALRHGLFGGDGLTLGRLAAVLDSKVKPRRFLAMAPSEQVKILEALDAATYAHPGPPDPNAPLDQKLWRTVKSGIVQSYYTTEIGGAKELTFDLVPGSKYRADVGVDEVPYLSNYWVENII